jgi:hypothetical protein
MWDDDGSLELSPVPNLLRVEDEIFRILSSLTAIEKASLFDQL